MPKTATGLDPDLYEYLIEHSLREPEVLAKLRAETAPLPRAGMQISPDQGQFLRLVVQLIGAKRVIEVGTFTGYSSLSMALALPDDGELITCDIDPEMTQIAQRYWQSAGLDKRITLRLGPAADSLAEVLADVGTGAFDMAFIDADKPNYQTYFDLCLQLVKPKGLVAVDNVLWSKRVLEESGQSEDTVAIQAFNARLKGDERVSISMLPLADGLTMAVKK